MMRVDESVACKLAATNVQTLIVLNRLNGIQTAVSLWDVHASGL